MYTQTQACTHKQNAVRTQGVTRTHVQRMSETRATGVRVEQKALYYVARHAVLRMNTLCRSIRCRMLCIDVSYATVCCIIHYSSLCVRVHIEVAISTRGLDNNDEERCFYLKQTRSHSEHIIKILSPTLSSRDVAQR